MRTFITRSQIPTDLLFCLTLSMSFKRLLLRHQTRVPVLYTEQMSSLSLEHVVPCRVLKQHTSDKNQTALQDPYNLFLTTKALNSVRSDYPFFLPSNSQRSILAYSSLFQKHFDVIGPNIYVSHSLKIFVPRVQDYSTICRSVLHCARVYGIQEHSVVLGGKPVVQYWASRAPTKKELKHERLAYIWLFRKDTR